MEKIKLQKNDVSIIKIELNGSGDYIAVSADDSTLFDRFASGYKRISELADEVPKKLDEIEKKYAVAEDEKTKIDMTVEMSRVNVDFSNEAVNIVDAIFGAGTVKKYFRDVYEEIPEFLPGAECFVDFFSQISPTMESIFSKKIEERNKKSMERMAKYKPQTHKRSSK